jgi:hypothetical protein
VTHEVLFTPELANSSLPLVRAIVGDVVDLESRIGEATDAYRELKADPKKPQMELNELRLEIGDLVQQRDACESELDAIGVRLGDAGRGICDFPSVLDGTPVYLCWELGEERVEYFHDRDAGFAGRQPLPVPVTAG